MTRTAYKARYRERFDPTDGHIVNNTPHGAVRRRDAWARNPPPIGVTTTYARNTLGEVRYFDCPRCTARRRYLYATELGWRCRPCAGIPYASRQHPDAERTYDIALGRLEAFALQHPDIATNLLSRPPTPTPRQPGRHRHRYDRLRARFAELQHHANTACITSVAAINDRYARSALDMAPRLATAMPRDHLIALVCEAWEIITAPEPATPQTQARIAAMVDAMRQHDTSQWLAIRAELLDQAATRRGGAR